MLFLVIDNNPTPATVRLRNIDNHSTPATVGLRNIDNPSTAATVGLRCELGEKNVQAFNCANKFLVNFHIENCDCVFL